MFAPSLTHNRYRLELFTDAHLEGLILAGQDERLWECAKPVDMNTDTYCEQYMSALKRNHENEIYIAYTVIDNDTNTPVGSSRYYDVSPANKRLSLGFTWYQPGRWGTGINAEVKLMLLSQVFESLAWNRVEFHVDARNKRSLSAMRYLGATEDGVLRRHKIVQGDFVRDTVLFSIVDTQWESVKERLEKRVT